MLEQYVEMAPEGLDNFTPEDRHEAYKALRLRVIAYPHGSIEASGVVVHYPGTIHGST